jgi:hypothetical protein
VAIPALFTVAGQCLVFFHFLCVFFAEIVCNTENLRNFVRGKHTHNITVNYLIFSSKDSKII